MRSSLVKPSSKPGSRSQASEDPAANQAFVETIIAFSKNLESERISTELQDLFLQYAETNERN